MSKHLLTICFPLLISACSITPEVAQTEANQKSVSGKLGVAHSGTQQNAEFVFCGTEKCPQRTPKYLPVPPAKVQPPIPAKIVETPKQEHFKVHFRWGWQKLDADGRKEIGVIVSSGLLKNAKSIIVAGRTDPTGPRKYNEKLAVLRAQTVKDALVMAGFPVEAITAVAQNPCCDGDLHSSMKAMREYRRTDIDITITTK